MTDTPKPVAWTYEIVHGPDGEANYAWVYRDKEMVATMRVHLAKEIVDAMNSDFLAMKERAEKAEEARDEAIRLMSEQATARGVAEGKLIASEIPGIIEGWKERAEAAEAELTRMTNNRDMYRGQVERQAKELERMHFDSTIESRHLSILAEALSEIKATSDGHSEQPISEIVSGCIAEIAALKGNTDV